MKLKTQLYINTSTDGENWELIDFFHFEDIEITSAIKTIQEVDKVFSDYSKEFVVPASKNNNKIFKHFYSTNISGGFDARIKRAGRIFINGVFFKQGYVRLQGSSIKDGYVYSYNLAFFGALSGLEDVIGEDELVDLTTLRKFNHDYDVNTVFSGLTKGLQLGSSGMEEYGASGVSLNRDVVYPLVSAVDKWYYDSRQLGSNPAGLVEEEFKEGKSTNIYTDDGTGTPSSLSLIHI